MQKYLSKLWLLSLLMLFGVGLSACHQKTSTKPNGTLVTPENFVRAESDRMFHKIVQQIGSVNTLFHMRNVTPLDQQTVIRMNRDTLYSMAIVDTSKGATLTLPQMANNRYISAHIIDNDHFTPEVIYTSGTHILPDDTQYILVLIRIQVFNPEDLEEIALINQIQDSISIQAESAMPLPPFSWDRASLTALQEHYNRLLMEHGSSKGIMGSRDHQVSQEERNILAAAGWGALPDSSAIYLAYEGPNLPDVSCYMATFQVPENDAFWSITMYNASGFLFSEQNIVNSSNVVFNDDGTFTLFFGSQVDCAEALDIVETLPYLIDPPMLHYPAIPNRLDITEGWNFLMRIYRPASSVIDGEYQLPEAVALPKP